MANIIFEGHGGNVVGSMSSGSFVQNMPSAMQLNGTNAYASGSTTMSTVTGTSATIAMWVYYTGSQNHDSEDVLFSDSSSESRKILIQTRNHSSHGAAFRYGYVDSAGGGEPAKDTGGAAGVLTSGAWTHVSLTANGTAVTLYINGKQLSDATYDAAGTNSYAIAYPHIGRAAFSTGRYFPGYIRDVQVYNVSSTTNELGRIMNGELPHGTPIHWWTCDNGATNDDGSATDSDLTLTNTVQDKSFYKLNQVGGGLISGNVTLSGGTWNLKNSTYIRPTGTNNTNANYVEFNDDQQHNGSRSYAMWFYLSTKASTQVMLSNYNSSNEGTQVFLNGGTTNLYLRLNNSNVNYITANENEWNHLVYVIDETANLAKGYLNGIEVTSSANNRTYGTVENMRLGADVKAEYPVNDGNYFGDYAYYEFALTPDQIQSMYEGKSYFNPETYLKLDEGTGNPINSGVGSQTASLTGSGSTAPAWVNPDYDIVMDAGGTPFMIEEDAVLSAPRGNLVLSGTTVNQPTYKIEGIYTHNSGTMIHRNAVDNYWRPSAVNKSGVNDFHKFKIEGSKTQWARGSWNVEDSIHLEGIMRLYANSTYSEGHTLTLGTTSSTGYVSGSSYIQAMTTTGTPGGSIIQGASKLYPAILSGTGTYKGALSTYRSVQLGNLQFDGKVTNEASMDSPVVTLIDDVYFKGGYDAHNGEKLVTTNQRAHFGATLDMESGVTLEASGSLLIFDDKIKTDGATVYNSGTSVICAHAGESTIRFNSGDWQNMMYNPTGGGVSFDTNANVARNLIVGGGYYDMLNAHLSGVGVGNLQVAAGAEFRGGNGNHLISGTFNTAGGFIGQGALDLDGTDYAGLGDGMESQTAVTLEAWVKPSEAPHENTILGTDASKGGILSSNTPNKFRIKHESVNSGYTDVDYNWVVDKWQHMCFTWDGTTGKAYADGKLLKEWALSGTPYNLTKAAIGSLNTGSTSWPWEGQIARGSFWKTALTESQIREMLFYDWAAVSGSSIDQTKCVGWYEFSNDNDATSISDMSGSGNTGTLNSTDAWAEGGNFTYNNSTMTFDNNGGVTTDYNVYAPRDGSKLEFRNITVTSGSAFFVDNQDGDQDLHVHGLIVNSGATFKTYRNLQYKHELAPIVASFSDLKLNSSTFYYFSSTSASLGVGTDYYSLRPGNTQTTTMQGDFKTTYASPYSDSVLKFGDGVRGEIYSLRVYNSGNVVMNPGSSILFNNSTKAFEKDEGGSKRSYITTNGEAAATFNWNEDANTGSDNISTAAYAASGGVTLVAWVKNQDGYNKDFFIGRGSRDGLGLWNNDRQLAMGIVIGGGDPDRLYSSNAVPGDGEWVHVAGVYDPSDSGKELKIYVSGALVAEGATSSSGYVSYDSSAWTIGGDGDSERYMHGSMADVRIYSGSALSAANIATLYNGGVNPAVCTSGAIYADSSNALGATGWWKLGGTDTGTLDLTDYAGSNNGTSNGAKTAFVRISGSSTPYKPMNNCFEHMNLTNTYISGSQDITVGAYMAVSTRTALTTAQLITKGNVVID